MFGPGATLPRLIRTPLECFWDGALLHTEEYHIGAGDGYRMASTSTSISFASTECTRINMRKRM